MIEFITQIAIFVVSGISLIAFFSALDAFFHERLDLTREAVITQPGRAFLIGLVNALFFGSILLGFVVLSQWISNLFLLPALVILAPLAAAILIGIGGMIAVAGERLFPGQPRRMKIVLAAAVLYVACLAPFVGWFGLTLYLALTGLGGFIVTLLRAR
jgi:hypothetical protein